VLQDAIIQARSALEFDKRRIRNPREMAENPETPEQTIKIKEKEIEEMDRTITKITNLLNKFEKENRWVIDEPIIEKYRSLLDVLQDAIIQARSALEFDKRRIRNPGARAKNPCPTVKNKRAFTQSDMNHAVKIYKAFTGFEPKILQIARIRPRTALVNLAHAISVTYESDKKDGEERRYIHTFEGPAALMWDIENNALVVIGKSLEITKAGIEG
jgi:hypothetical protein